MTGWALHLCGVLAKTPKLQSNRELKIRQTQSGDIVQDNLATTPQDCQGHER